LNPAKRGESAQGGFSLIFGDISLQEKLLETDLLTKTFPAKKRKPLQQKRRFSQFQKWCGEKAEI
jgi:hypothetical protein